jgi:phosphoadenosine phosphosulfate reductase
MSADLDTDTAADVSALPWASAAAASSAIGLYARHTAGFEDRLAATVRLLQQAAEQHPGSVVLANSLGAEDMVLTDLIARHRLPIAIGTLQTGRLHSQTLALIPQIEARYGLTVDLFSPPDEAVVHFVRQHGDKPMFQSIDLRKACCQLRKLEPLGRMLAGRSAWVTGLRAEQSNHRADMPAHEIEANGRAKFNPLVDWTWADIWHYISTYSVPYNELHDQFMPSIGCEPCTRAIAVGEEFRSGRWWWEDEHAKECGLHVKDQAADQPVSA